MTAISPHGKKTVFYPELVECIPFNNLINNQPEKLSKNRNSVLFL